MMWLSPMGSLQTRISMYFDMTYRMRQEKIYTSTIVWKLERKKAVR
jgi:hypothetical protein